MALSFVNKKLVKRYALNRLLIVSTLVATLDSVPQEMKGSAAALIGSLQYGSGILSLAMLAAFSAGTPWTMSWIIALFVWLSALAAYFNK